jgi:hypothetical protein
MTRFTILLMLSMLAVVHAENWKLVRSTDYGVYAPASFEVRTEPPNVILSNPKGMIMSMGVIDNFSRSGRLPDIYEIYGFLRHAAVAHNVQLTTEPDAGGRPIAGREAIGAYAGGTIGSHPVDLRIYVTLMPGNSRRILGVVVLTDPGIERDAEAYRYAMLDAIVLDQPTSAPSAGRYTINGIGSIGGLSTYAGSMEIWIQPGLRYRMGTSEVIGSSIYARAAGNEQGTFVPNGNDLILFSDAMPVWPAHNNGHLPRRISLTP